MAAHWPNPASPFGLLAAKYDLLNTNLFIADYDKPPLVDMIPIAKPLIGDEERALIEQVLQSGMLAQGQMECEICKHRWKD